jgi:hypothetical protein
VQFDQRLFVHRRKCLAKEAKEAKGKFSGGTILNLELRNERGRNSTTFLGVRPKRGEAFRSESRLQAVRTPHRLKAELQTGRVASCTQPALFLQIVLEFACRLFRNSRP